MITFYSSRRGDKRPDGRERDPAPVQHEVSEGGRRGGSIISFLRIAEGTPKNRKKDNRNAKEKPYTEKAGRILLSTLGNRSSPLIGGEKKEKKD